MWKLKLGEGKDNPWLASVNNHIGRQHWEFDPDAGTPEDHAEVERVREEFKKNRFKTRQGSDLLMRMQMRRENPSVVIPAAIKLEEGEKITEEAVITTLRRAIGFLSSQQAHDGHWPNECTGALYFLPSLVITLYITGSINEIFCPEHKKEIKRYTYNCQNEDGGWGFYLEGPSTMLGSAINYIALRLLGEGPNDGEDNAMARGRQWILDHGSAVGIPSWGKFWLTVLGVYEWDGCNPIPPESWLLPTISPIHPGKMMMYCRSVYMPMSYIYGKRFVGQITPLVQTLRNELYTQPYHEINWNKARNNCAKEDLYCPHSMIQDMAWGFLHHFVEPLLKRWPLSKLREKALKVAMDHVHYEDLNSRYLCIGVVEKVLSMLAVWAEDANSEAYKKHLARVPDYLWVAEDGMKAQALGSQTWDVSFTVRAICATGLVQEYAPTLMKAHDFLKASQVLDNPPGNFEKMYRHISKGAWTFEVPDQGLQVSDATGEGLQASLLLSQISTDLVGEKIEAQRFYDAVNVLISMQSENGGFPAWEPKRAFRWMETFNPTEMYEEVLIERDYVECTSAAVQALILFSKFYPAHRRKEVKNVISKGIHYIEEIQNPDGSWYGHWGICYTYAAFFAAEALAASGKRHGNSLTLRKACEFLLSKQLPDGGWGESFLSCVNKVYTNIDGNKSNVVNTAWALLALIRAGQADVDPIPIERGVRLLINLQMKDGKFPQQEASGIFFRNCIIHYPAYTNVFPIWALGEYRHLHARGSTIH